MTTYNDTISNSILSVNTITTTGDLNNSITQLINYLSTVPTPPIVLILNNSLTINQTTSTDIFTKLLDTLEILESSTDSLVTKDTIIDLLAITESLIISYNSSISENILFTSTFIAYLNNVIELINSVIIDSTVSDKITYFNSIIDLINTISKVQFVDIIIDTLIVNQVLTDLYKVVNILLESLVLTDATSSKYIHILSLSELITLDDTDSNKVTTKEVLSDLFIIKLPGYLDDAKYLAYTLAPESMSVTNYTNFNFNNCTKYNNKYLFSNAIGLYEYGAVTDDGALITSYIETAGLTFGTSNLKSIPSFYLGYSSDGASILRVRVDGKGTFHYKLNKYSNNLETKKMDIGKGLVGRYFQFEIITDAEEFNLESMEFYPVVLKRKI